MKNTLVSALVAIGLVGAAGVANAHTVSYGFENAGSGAVTIWFGSYHSSYSGNEGYLQIQGINGNAFPSTSLDFDLLTGTRPAGMPVDDYVSPGYPVSNITTWQGVTFSSVQAGDYSFFFNSGASLNGNPATTVVFHPWESGVQSGTFTLTADVVQTPDGGSTALMLGASLIGFGAVRRKVLNK